LGRYFDKIVGQYDDVATRKAECDKFIERIKTEGLDEKVTEAEFSIDYARALLEESVEVLRKLVATQKDATPKSAQVAAVTKKRAGCSCTIS